jgi:hypothetical protein
MVTISRRPVHPCLPPNQQSYKLQLRHKSRAGFAGAAFVLTSLVHGLPAPIARGRRFWVGGGMWEEVEDAPFEREEIGAFVAFFCNKGDNEFERQPRHYLPVHATSWHTIQTNTRTIRDGPLITSLYISPIITTTYQTGQQKRLRLAAALKQYPW